MTSRLTVERRFTEENHPYRSKKPVLIKKCYGIPNPESLCKLDSQFVRRKKSLPETE
jgi:hypothetical protein